MRNTILIIISFCFLTLASWAGTKFTKRTWVHAETGQQIEAVFKGLTETDVLVNTDRKTLHLPLRHLSESDLNYLAKALNTLKEGLRNIPADRAASATPQVVQTYRSGESLFKNIEDNKLPSNGESWSRFYEKEIDKHFHKLKNNKVSLECMLIPTPKRNPDGSVHVVMIEHARNSPFGKVKLKRNSFYGFRIEGDFPGYTIEKFVGMKHATLPDENGDTFRITGTITGVRSGTALIIVELTDCELPR